MRSFLTNKAKVSLALVAVNVLQRIVGKFVTKFVTIGSGAVFAILSNVNE